MSRFPMPIPHGWYFVSYSEDLVPGESKPLHYFDTELVLFRTEKGEPVLMEAYCPHMGAHLGHGIHENTGQGGQIKGDTISCPFHGWTFNKKGFVVNIPYAEKIPPKVKDKKCIRTFPLKEVNKTIMAWYHPDQVEPIWDAVQFDEAEDDSWTRFDKYEYKFGAHLQETAENGADSAHFVYVHGTATLPEWEFSYERHKRTGVMKAKMPTPRGEVDGAIHQYGYGPGQSATRFTGICETFLMGLPTPVNAEKMELRFAFSQQKENGKDPKGGVAAAIIADINKQVQEDIPIWENKKFLANPILCSKDGPISQFRKWFKQFYSEDWEAIS